MTEGASCFNTGAKCEGINCTHVSHQVGTEPAGVVVSVDLAAGDSWSARLCEHGIGTDQDGSLECSRCTREGRELR